MTSWFFVLNSAILCYDRISVSEKLEKSVSIFLTTLNYKKLHIEKKRKNKKHQMVSKTDKIFFFLLPKNETDYQFNSKSIYDIARI